MKKTARRKPKTPTRNAAPVAERARHGRPKPTSYDVALLADVSQSAVSRCFRPDASISADKRARVLKAAKQLGYAPDAIARSLTTRRSNLVGIIISNLTNLYYPEVLSELNARFAERGVHVLLFTIQLESDVDRILSQVWQYRLDGVIAAARLGADEVRAFERRGVPLVFYNRYLRDRAVNAVCCDQTASAHSIVDRLVAAGHRRIALIGGPPDSVVGAERVAGCLDRLKTHGMRRVPVVAGDYTYRGGRAALAELLGATTPAPDAVICSSDAMALGCMDAARHEHGLRVPEAMSIVGFDGVEPGTWSSFELTTVRQPVKEMAAAAADLLLACVEDPKRAPEKRVFSGTFVAGRSART